SYAKGASALRQLVTWLGEKDFLAGINTHFTRHRFANAALADFIDSLASATERDVHAWADTWLRTTGVDTLRPVVTRGEEGTYTLQVEHKGSRPHRIAVGLYDLDVADEGRHLVLRDRLDLDVPQSTPQPIGKRPTLLLLNDGDLTYAKVRFDTESFKAVTECLSGLPSPLTRAVVWNALRDAVRDGELPPTAYLDVARAHLPHETDLALVQGVLAFASTYVADRYTTPE
ncbi:ERAP1-like C-terminal domain-containing protein, partial [Streptomyces sp. RP5T]|uniref:ERAP1-like C-terminal domain-containing protein n=2 Tax=Streptomyces TaxID=1883 RepID=UPI000FBE1342